MKKIFHILFTVLLTPLVSSAKTAGKPLLTIKDTPLIQKLADRYFSESFITSLKNPSTDMNCSESSSSLQCVKYICELNFKCDQNDMLQTVKACRGNTGSSCLRYICGIKNDCAFYEMISAANACKANSDTDCIKYICELNYNCDFDGILQAAKSCGGTAGL